MKKQARNIREALHDLDSMKLFEDVFDKDVIAFLKTEVFNEEYYEIDDRVEDVCGRPALGVTCKRGDKSSRMVVTVVPIGGDSPRTDLPPQIYDIRRVTKELADSEGCTAVVMVLYYELEYDAEENLIGRHFIDSIHFL